MEFRGHTTLWNFNEEIQTKGQQRLWQLIIKFGQLTMTAIETLPDFIDRIRYCIAEIRACDPSQVPSDEAGIKFAFPHLNAALQVAQKLSLEDLFELMDAFNG